ncbi:MAG: hypothetical protein ACKVY0_13825 [Prosthecobacter sp.]|uniref:hypothetical protein n=1 Tax=Prosthecobacter sp. TaxID=1965333 RepID=UPI0039008427
MKSFTAILSLIGFFAVSLPAWPAPGDNDAEVLGLLRRIHQTVPLHQIMLKDVAPQFALAKHDGLGWKEAVAEADKRFGTKPEQIELRAAFLRKHLVAGMPEADLQALKLTEWGASLSAGSTRSKSFVFGTLEKPTALLHFGIAHGTKTLVSAPTLMLVKASVSGFDLERLDFNIDDRLVGWSCQTRLNKSKDRVPLGANNSGSDGVNYFYASITKSDNQSEDISFTPDLVIKERRVSGKPRVANAPKMPGVQTTREQDYCEIYEGGKLRKRLHYGERQDKNGTESVIVKEEVFD